MDDSSKIAKFALRKLDDADQRLVLEVVRLVVAEPHGRLTKDMTALAKFLLAGAGGVIFALFLSSKDLAEVYPGSYLRLLLVLYLASAAIGVWAVFDAYAWGIIKNTVVKNRLHLQKYLPDGAKLSPSQEASSDVETIFDASLSVIYQAITFFVATFVMAIGFLLYA